MKKRLWATILSGIMAVSIFGGCALNDKPVEIDKTNLTPLKVAVLSGQPEQYAATVGIHQGIFAKYGIDLEIVSCGYGTAAFDAVVSGDADIAEMYDYEVVNRIGNTYGIYNYVVFSEMTPASELSGGLYVAPDYVDNLEALDGSEGFMTTIGTVNHYFMSKAIEWLGIDYDKQNIMNVESVGTALTLAHEECATAYVVSGANTTTIETDEWQQVVSFEELGITTGTYLVADKEYVDENAELIANYLLALEESARCINEDIEKNAIRIADTIGTRKKVFKEIWTTYSLTPGFTEEGAVHLNEIRAWAYDAGHFDAEYDIKEFIDLSVIESVFPDRITVELQ